MSPSAPESAAPSPAIELSGLGASYGRRKVLSNISFDVRAGEIVGLLGPNGAGKSTLVRALSGVLGTYTGGARILGGEVRDLPARELALRVAVVPQEPRFEFSFTVLEIVLMGRHPHLAGLEFESEIDIAVARQALADVGAEELALRPIDELSAGERQRVVFARALAQASPVLLLDEPASFLDLRHQVELFDRLRELALAGRAIVAVMHDLNLAAEYCDRVVLLSGGSVAAAGDAGEVLTWAHLTAVYGTEIYVDLNDITGRLVVTPLSGRARARLRAMQPEADR